MGRQPAAFTAACGAARARDAAVIAERSGEPSRVEFWVEVCATLDRRMARDFLKRKRS